jgi:hypothetical protein
MFRSCRCDLLTGTICLVPLNINVFGLTMIGNSLVLQVLTPAFTRPRFSLPKAIQPV